MTNHEIVKKIIGEINPIGETQTDDERFENLKAMTELVDQLISDIYILANKNKDRYEFSMSRAGKFADKFLDELGIK